MRATAARTTEPQADRKTGSILLGVVGPLGTSTENSIGWPPIDTFKSILILGCRDFTLSDHSIA
jgi:hypothetical protein